MPGVRPRPKNVTSTRDSSTSPSLGTRPDAATASAASGNSRRPLAVSAPMRRITVTSTWPPSFGKSNQLPRSSQPVLSNSPRRASDYCLGHGPRGAARARTAPADGALRGRLSRKKRIDVVASATEGLPRIVAGDGPLRHLRSRVAGLGVEVGPRRRYDGRHARTPRVLADALRQIVRTC